MVCHIDKTISVVDNRPGASITFSFDILCLSLAYVQTSGSSICLVHNANIGRELPCATPAESKRMEFPDGRKYL